MEQESLKIVLATLAVRLSCDSRSDCRHLSKHRVIYSDPCLAVATDKTKLFQSREVSADSSGAHTKPSGEFANRNTLKE